MTTRRLTRATIVAEAIRLVRTDGLAAITMRRLADHLGTAPMSLYRHIGDRDTLLVAMLDEVARSIAVPERASDPRAEITALFTAVHDALRRDPWAIPLIVTDRLAGPAILPLLERLFVALRQAGLAPRDAMVAYSLLWHYTSGELLNTHPPVADVTFAQSMVRGADAEVYPAFAESVAVFAAGPAGDWFTENLHRILDGLLPRTVYDKESRERSD